MTLEEMARALGCQTEGEISEECGFPPEHAHVVGEMVAAEMTAPTLVLDFRGGVDARTRWAKYARVGALPPAVMPKRLDPRTGLAVKRARKK